LPHTLTAWWGHLIGSSLVLLQGCNRTRVSRRELPNSLSLIRFPSWVFNLTASTTLSIQKKAKPLGCVVVVVIVRESAIESIGSCRGFACRSRGWASMAWARDSTGRRWSPETQEPDLGVFKSRGGRRRRNFSPVCSCRSGATPLRGPSTPAHLSPVRFNVSDSLCSLDLVAPVSVGVGALG
jgi:hypothetical protein